MKKINATGKPCPIPVIETKKAIRELENSGGLLEVTVDNELAIENIKKMTDSLDNIEIIDYTVKQNYRTLCLNVLVNEQKSQLISTELVIGFGSNQMGSGSEELGKVLLKSYIHSLTELDNLPTHLFFFNSGAKLTNQNSNTLEDLRYLLEKGAKISTCGACLDFYKIKETLALGEITNMYTICETMASATKVITL